MPDTTSGFRAWYLVASWTVNAGALVGVFWVRGGNPNDWSSPFYVLGGWLALVVTLFAVACGYVVVSFFRRAPDFGILVDWLVPLLVILALIWITGSFL